MAVVGCRIAPSCQRHDGLITVPGCESDVIFDMQLGVVDVTLVMTDGPFGGFLGPDGIGPPEPYDARTDGDAKTSRFRFGASASGTRCPRCRRLEQCRSGGDHLGAREPQSQCIDRPQLAGLDPVEHRVADIFGTYNKPAGRGRVEVGCLG